MGWPVWGKDAPRRFFGDSHWAQPLAWNRSAAARGVEERVFCGSMCDLMETYSGHVDQSLWSRFDSDPAARIREARELLWKLIAATPNLLWLLLTKRPDGFRKYLPAEWLRHGCPRNVWLLVTVESPAYYWRWRELARYEAVVRGISYEPALEPVDIDQMCARGGAVPNWFIIGGESVDYLPSVRPFDLVNCGTKLVTQCRRRGIVPYVKQMGSAAFVPDVYLHDIVGLPPASRTKQPLVPDFGRALAFPGKGDQPERWPPALRVQEYPLSSL